VIQVRQVEHVEELGQRQNAARGGVRIFVSA